MGNILGGLFGGGGNSAADQASKAAQTQADNAAKVNQQLIALIQQIQNERGSYITPLEGPLGSAASGLLTDPTQLSKAAPGLMDFYGSEMHTGIDPRFALNAQNQLQQGFDQTLSDITAHLGPGQSGAAAEKSAMNSLLGDKVNLGAQLAGQSQMFENEGAQGLASTATGLDTQKMSIIDLINSIVHGGDSLLGGAMSGLGGLGGQYSNAATNDLNLAMQGAQGQQNSQNQLWNLLLNLGLFFGTGGFSAGAGGIGAPISSGWAGVGG